VSFAQFTPKVVLHPGKGATGEVALEVTRPLVAGRADNADIVVQDVLVSRRHCRFLPDPRGVVVVDLDSQNGTWVNGELVSRATLAHNDVVRIGNSRLQVRLEALDTSPDPGVGHTSDPAVVRSKPVDPSSIDSLHNATVAMLENEQAVGQTLHEPGGAAWLSRHTRNVAALYQAGQIVQREQDPDEMLNAVLRLLARVLVARTAAFVLVDEGGDLQVRAAIGATGRAVAPEEIQLSRTYARQVMDERLGLITEDATRDHRLPQSHSIVGLPAGAMMLVPVLVGNRALGVLQLNSSRSGADFHEDDLDLASTLAGMAGTALQNKEMAIQQERTIAELRKAKRELEEAQQALVKAERAAAIGQIASAFAHDARNALQAVQGLELLRPRYPCDEELHLYVDLALEGQQMVVDMVEEILAFVRGTEVDDAVVEVNLAGLARSMVRFCRLDPDVRGRDGALPHALELDLRVEPVVHAAPRRLKQVILNLIKNAAQAIEARPGRIVVRVDRGPGGAVVSVLDDGPGIPTDVQARVFEPMFTTKSERGVGLGLHICRSICERYGGTLDFETEPGLGTAFRMTLPEAG
jgi:signal transduction histidine kinase